MIKFFRRIRLRLLTQASSDEVRQKRLMDLPRRQAGNKASKPASRTGRYLFYAIGEIVLVVIGILIALQINNWNEQRKEANFEEQILESFKESLESDLSDIKDNMAQHRRGLGACDSLISFMESEEEIIEDSLARLFSEAIFSTRFVHSTSAFESLKSKGVNIISNNELQKKIVDVYDSRYRFFIESEKDYVEYYMLGLNSVFPGRFEEGFNYNMALPGFPGDLRPIDFESLKQDEEFVYYLKTMRNWTYILIEFHYSGLQDDVEELLEMIDEELKFKRQS